MKTKNFILVLLIAFISFSSKSQDLNLAFSYFNAGEYEKAAYEFEKVLSEAQSQYGYNDTTVVTKIILFTAVSFERAQMYEKAKRYYWKGYVTYTLYDDITDITFKDYLFFLANLYIKYLGVPKLGINFFIEELRFLEKMYGKENVEYLNILTAIAFTYYTNLQNYQKAKEYFEKASELAKKLYGENSKYYITSINNLALTYSEIGNFAKAFELNQKALDLAEKNFGKEADIYLTSLQNLGSLYGKIGEYKKAFKILKKVADVYKKNKGENSPEYAYSLNTLGGMYLETGFYEKAINYFTKANEIFEYNFGKNSKEYAISLSNISNAYQKMGYYEKAILLEGQTLIILKNIGRANSTDMATALNNMATIYADLGDFTSAITLQRKALEIDLNIYGEKNPNVASDLSNLGVLFYKMGDRENAVKFFTKALETYEKTYGKNSVDYAQTLNNLAKVLQAQKQYQKALDLYNQALEIFKDKLGEENYEYANTLINIATVYRDMKNYDKALPLYLENLKIYKKIFGEQHPFYINSINELAKFYIQSNNLPNAKKYITLANSSEINLIKNNFSFMSENQKLSFWLNEMSYFDIYNSFYFKNQKIYPELGGYAYNNALFQKGLLLRSSVALKKSILNSNDKQVKELFDSLKIVTFVLEKELDKPFSQRKLNTDSLLQIKDNLENQIISRNSDYKNYIQSITTDWKEIQNHLKPNQAAIEYLIFQYFDGERFTDSVYYVAIVLKKYSQYPKIIFLCNKDSLEDLKNIHLVKSDRGFVLTDQKDGNTENLPKSVFQKYYSLIWQPLEKELTGINEVFISPTGYIYRIPLQVLYNRQNKRLIDVYKIHYLTTTANILDTKQYIFKNSDDLVLFGGIDYNDYDFDNVQENEDLTTIMSEGKLFKSKFLAVDYLQFTQKEVDSISEIANKFSVKIQKYEGRKATETAFRNLTKNNPKIIHLATHGFYIDDTTGFYWKNPMNRSGLLFAGVNLTLAGRVPSKTDDGILTAKEFQSLNFYGTDLIVLSACQTALGDIGGNEGIYGLQRAVKSSGIDYMIITLWEVNDFVTYKFMKRFYRNLFRGMELEKAFNDAVKYIRFYGFHPSGIKYGTESDIIYWAPFVLVK